MGQQADDVHAVGSAMVKTLGVAYTTALLSIRVCVLSTTIWQLLKIPRSMNTIKK